ncbi:MAG TPA: 6-bladed beta-propeller, partial [Balneolaceae bacterium]|nr:6-bladed beta-propeller [Balneolaceae bacterium]
LAKPGGIQAVPNGFLLFDLGTHRICHFNANGQQLLCFGHKGKGPGEYLNANGIWEFKNKYLVYDRRNKKFITYGLNGKHIKDIPIKFTESTKMLPFQMDAISPSQMIMPSGGKDGSLLKRVNIKTDSTRYFGKTGSVPDVVSNAPAKLLHALDFKAFKNRKISFGSNRSGIFVFHDLTAKLEKYSFSGKLLWQKSIKIPAIRHLFRHIIRKDKGRLNQGKFLLTFSYSEGVSVNKKGVAILLYVLKKQPVTVVWVPNDGSKTTVVTFPKLKKSFPLFLNFALSKDGSVIYFVNIRNGEIYRAHWPL